jgi:hypothetical protein
MTEAQLLAEVLRLAEMHGLNAFHVYDSRKATGTGYPDLTLVGPLGVLWAELKDQYGILSPEQVSWRYALIASGQSYALWRPSDLESGLIESELRCLAYDYAA